MPHRLSAASALDSLSNLAASLNAGKDKQGGDAFFIAELARDQIESMYRGDWLARKIVDIVPYDCVREWREWHGEPADVARIEATERRLGLQRAVQRAMVLGRLYGGGALIVGTRERDPAALASELLPEAVGPNGIAFLHAVSRWQLGVAETERDPLSPWFGEPVAYEVTAPERGALTLHPSRVIRFLGSPLPDPGLFGANLWSDSVLTALYDAIHAVALTTTGATSLMHEAKVDVVTVPNLSEHLSNAATTAQLSSRFAYAATMKSINNLLLLGDGETWAREKIDFGGLPAMVQTFLQVAAGAADIPVTRLLGQSPAGLSATGDSDTRNYYDMIAARQAIDLRPQLERLDSFLLASAGVAPNALRFDFRPLWQMDPGTAATVALQKAQATQIYAGLGLWPSEVMFGLVAGQLAEDGTYPNAGAAFGTAAANGPRQIQDFSPDQPRDPQGRWTNGGGALAERSEGAAREGATIETPQTLTIQPTVSSVASKQTPRQTPELGEAVLNPNGSSVSPVLAGNTQLNSPVVPHAPDGTAITLAGLSRKGRTRALAALFGSAAKLVQRLSEYLTWNEPDSPEPISSDLNQPAGPAATPTSQSAASGGSVSGKKFTPEETAGLNVLFSGGGQNKSVDGAQRLLKQLDEGSVQLPPQVTKDVLERYAKLAQKSVDDGIDKLGVQALRLRAINKILER